MSTVQINQYSIDTLCYSNDSDIYMVSGLSSYISTNPDYLAISQPDVEKMISGFVLIHVSFVTINFDTAHPALFDAVYQKSLYTLSFENIAQMLRLKYEIESNEDITHKNYSLVQSQANSPLGIYISKNMTVYLNIIIENCDGRINDEESVVIELLNNTDIESAQKIRYIDVLSTAVSDITQVTDTILWTALMNNRMVMFQINNLVNYFNNYKIDASLVRFINDEPSEINFTTISEEYGNEIAGQLFDEISTCNAIATDKYKKALVDLGYYYDNYEATEIADDKFTILIEEELLRMGADALTFVRDKYSQHIFGFIKCNLDAYLALQSDALFKLEEALQIITWDFDDDKKTNLLAFYDEAISVVGKNYSDTVISYIISNNLDTKDKPYLYANYSKYGGQTQEAIMLLANTSIGAKEIINNSMKIDDTMLSILLQSDTITREQKILLFTMSIPLLNEATCMAHFDELGLPDLKGIFAKSSGRRNYEKSDEITEIFDALLSNNWIYEYREDDRNNEKYIVVKNKPTK